MSFLCTAMNKELYDHLSVDKTIPQPPKMCIKTIVFYCKVGVGSPLPSTDRGQSRGQKGAYVGPRRVNRGACEGQSRGNFGAIYGSSVVNEWFLSPKSEFASVPSVQREFPLGTLLQCL